MDDEVDIWDAPAEPPSPEEWWVDLVWITLLALIICERLLLHYLFSENYSQNPGRILGAYAGLGLAWYLAWRLALEARDRVALTVLGVISFALGNSYVHHSWPTPVCC